MTPGSSDRRFYSHRSTPDQGRLPARKDHSSQHTALGSGEEATKGSMHRSQHNDQHNKAAEEDHHSVFFPAEAGEGRS